MRVCILFYACVAVANVLLHFPFATDPPVINQPLARKTALFYNQTYAPSRMESGKDQTPDEKYVRVAERAAKISDVEGKIRRFVSEYHLESRRVLDVGAGRGYLQDVVGNYVGLDISATAARFFHKPFVAASATAMPFSDGEFDAAWSIWVLEHIPNPESALQEMRRVVRPGGVIFLMPAWFCSSSAADGYDVRPYKDLGLPGKVSKASLLLRNSPLFQFTYILPIRTLRYVGAAIGRGPTAFHYTRLRPNYDTYWQPDSDAVNSMDPYEVVLWFESRGDRCLSCSGGSRNITSAPQILVIQVKPT